MTVLLGSEIRYKSYTPDDVVTAIPAQYHMNGAVQESLFSGAGSLPVTKVARSIAYTTRRRADRHKSNWCRHVKSLRVYQGDATSPVRLTFTGPVGHVGHYVDYLGGHFHSSSAHDTAVSVAYGASQLNVSATPTYFGNAQTDIDATFQHLRPDLTAISLPNFLIELKDVGKLFQLWKGKLSTAKNVAGAHLNYSFGWKPLMSDIRAMCDVLGSLVQRIEEFEKACDVISKSHYTFDKVTTYKRGTTTYGSTGTVDWSGSVIRSKKSGLIYRPQPFQVTRGYKMMLRAYLDALGFELNPAIVWNAIPFTFVIDWFFGIGSWLERHTYDTLELPFLWVDSYVHYKEAVQVESRLRLTHANVATATYYSPWVTSRTYFERIPAKPTEGTFAGLGWRLPTQGQATLLVSLATVLRR